MNQRNQKDSTQPKGGAGRGPMGGGPMGGGPMHGAMMSGEKPKSFKKILIPFL
jgi:hypothetical protein